MANSGGARRAGGPRPSLGDLSDLLVPGATVGTGPVPHRGLAASLDFGCDASDVPTAPIPARHDPRQTGAAQVLAGVVGITTHADGTFAVDPGAIDHLAPVAAGLDRPEFEALRAFVERCRRRQHTGPVRWGLTGPVAVTRELCRRGVPTPTAAAVALAAVRTHLTVVAAEFAEAAPRAVQVVVLDEAAGGPPGDTGLAPSEATDVLSAALAAVERCAVAGVRGGADADVPLLLEAGPRLIELPTSLDPATYAGYLTAFLERGGWVVWDVLATDGPIVDTPTRAWKRLSEVWCALVQRGCDLTPLRRQAWFAPGGGLDAHSPAGASQIAATVADVARLARADAGAARFVLGA